MSPKKEYPLNPGKSVSLGDSKPSKKSKRVKEESKHKALEDLQKSSDKVLFRARTVFPFKIFPDIIVVDYQKISIARKQFFLSEKVNSINHADILQVEADTGPLFATLIIRTKYFNRTPMRLRYLRKHHAIKLRDLIHGLITAKQEDISFSEVSKKRLSQELQEIGKIEE